MSCSQVGNGLIPAACSDEDTNSGDRRVVFQGGDHQAVGQLRDLCCRNKADVQLSQVSPSGSAQKAEMQPPQFCTDLQILGVQLHLRSWSCRRGIDFGGIFKGVEPPLAEDKAKASQTQECWTRFKASDPLAGKGFWAAGCCRGRIRRPGPPRTAPHHCLYLLQKAPLCKEAGRDLWGSGSQAF